MKAISQTTAIEDEIDLRQYLNVIQKRWRTIIVLTVVAGTLTWVYNMFQPPIFEAKTTILVRQAEKSGFAQTVGLTGINLLTAGAKNLHDLRGALQSRAVAKRVFEELKLRERIPDWDNSSITDDELIEELQRSLIKPQISALGNIMEVKVWFGHPEFAAEIANGFVHALSYHWNQLNHSEANREKKYIESQLPRIEENLKHAEKKVKTFTLFSSATQNSEFTQLPPQSIEFLRATRELEIQNSVYVSLRKEYESTQLEEAKRLPPFSVLDIAQVPKQKSFPRVKLNTFFGFLFGMFFGTVVAFFQEYWVKSSQQATA